MKKITRCACVVAVFTIGSAWSLAPANDDPQKFAGPLADGEFKIGPKYTDAPELKVKDGVPKGTLHEFTMTFSGKQDLSRFERALQT